MVLAKMDSRVAKSSMVHSMIKRGIGKQSFMPKGWQDIPTEDTE